MRYEIETTSTPFTKGRKFTADVYCANGQAATEAPGGGVFVAEGFGITPCEAFLSAAIRAVEEVMLDAGETLPARIEALGSRLGLGFGEPTILWADKPSGLPDVSAWWYGGLFVVPSRPQRDEATGRYFTLMFEAVEYRNPDFNPTIWEKLAIFMGQEEACSSVTLKV